MLECMNVSMWEVKINSNGEGGGPTDFRCSVIGLGNHRAVVTSEIPGRGQFFSKPTQVMWLLSVETIKP